MTRLLFLALALTLFSCSKDSAELTSENGKSGSITRFAVYGDYMYALNQNEIQTYLLGENGQAALVHTIVTDYGLETITIYEGTVFVGSRTALYLLDISNPAAPVILSKSDRMQTVGFNGCDPVVVKGDYAYSTIKIVENVCGMVSSSSALVVYDISDTSYPEVAGVYEMSIPNGLAIYGDYLFVCDEGLDRVVIFDIGNPLSVLETPYSFPLVDPVDLIIDGERAIISTKTSFVVYSIADMSQITRLGQINR